jgi:hypothetical protein
VNVLVSTTVVVTADAEVPLPTVYVKVARLSCVDVEAGATLNIAERAALSGVVAAMEVGIPGTDSELPMVAFIGIGLEEITSVFATVEGPGRVEEVDVAELVVEVQAVMLPYWR